MREINETIVKTESEDDINIADLLVGNGLIDEYYYYQDAKERRFYLNDYVCHETVDGIIQQIIKINSDDIDLSAENRMPITILLDTYGGDFYTGFKLIDTIEASKTPVIVVNMSCCYSMGLYICMAGHRRFAMKNARFLLHDGELGVQNSGMKVQDFIEFDNKMKEKERDYVLSHSRISEEVYSEKMGHDWYMFADEAKELGVVDYIIGEDGVELSDIFNGGDEKYR